MGTSPVERARHRYQTRILTSTNQYALVQEKRSQRLSTVVQVADETFEIVEPLQPTDDLTVCESSRGTFSVLHGGKSITAHVQRVDREHISVTVGNQTIDVSIADHRSQLLKQYGVATEDVCKDSDVRSPMPGLVVTVLVNPGDIVERDQGLLVLEAMKMENELRSGSPGRIVSILVHAGDTVSKDELLVVVEPIETL